MQRKGERYGTFLWTSSTRDLLPPKSRYSELVVDEANKDGDLYIRSVCFSPDGNYLATAAEDRQIRVSHPHISSISMRFTMLIYSLNCRSGISQPAPSKMFLMGIPKQFTQSTFRAMDV